MYGRQRKNREISGTGLMHRSTLFLVILSILISTDFIQAQSFDSYGFGSVIGGDTRKSGLNATSFLEDNEQGIRVVLVRSQSSGVGSLRGSRGGGGIQIYDIPKDTDYLELIMFYAKMDPRSIHKKKIKILRVKSTGDKPYLSENTYRYWTSHNFEEEYERGGPFETLRPGDIVIIEGRGIFNRPFFDPLTDINFLLTLPTLVLSFLSLYNTFL